MVPGTEGLRRAAQDRKDHIAYVPGPPRDALGFSALLIRPDGVVAWASEHTPDRAAFERAAARWFGRPEK